MSHELTEGVRIICISPRVTRQARNLPAAALNLGKVTDNIAKEVSLWPTAGPFDGPSLRKFQVSCLTK